jgi:DNA-damage-inducible protein J
MSTNDMVRARIDSATKDEAAKVLSGMGLTVSDACRMTLTMIARDKRLPFGREPNELTRRTLEMSDRGEDVHHAEDLDDLLRKLRS